MNRIEAGHFEASGAAVTLSFHALPDVFMAWNQTKFATDASNIVLFHAKDYAAGDASIILNEADAGIGVVEATNGITQTSSVAYAETASDVSASATITLGIGSAFYGADSDEIHYLAIWADKYTDHGDINA